LLPLKIKNMKKLHYIFIILMSIVSFLTLQSLNNNQSGNKAWNSCAGASCHNSNTATTVSAISLIDNTTNLPVTEYEGGKVYKIIMTGNNTSLSQFGFQLRETNNKGTFSNFPANVGKQALGFITHSSRLSKTGLFFSVEMTWTAPAAGSGSVSFDGLINAVDGNSNNSGDAVSAVKTVTYNEKIASTFALTCANINTTGSITSGSAASGVSFSVPYTGATSGASYSAVNVNSTGVTGLTASLTAGIYSGSSGNLTFNVTGTPSGTGTASFGFTVNGASCTHNINVNAASVFALNCSNSNTSGSLINGTVASGVTYTVPYSGATVGGTYNAVNATSTGVSGLTATIASGTFTTTSGNLTLAISGTPSGTGTASFSYTINGKTCSFTIPVGASNSLSLNCANATSTGTLKANIATTGVAFTLPYTNATSGGSYSAVNASSTGVTGLTATLSAGTFSTTSGNLTLNVTGTPTSMGTASFLVNIAGKTCTLTKTVTSNIAIISNELNPISISYQNNLLTIQGDQANKINELTALNLNGKIVYNQEIHTNAQKLVLNNLNLNKGMYILQIKMNDGSLTSKKLVIQ
jgi:hypothetical protein